MRYIFIILMTISSLFSEEIVKVIATGLGSDTEQAKKVALKNAIEQVIGLKIESETYVKNYITLKDNIYGKSEGFIKSYKVIWTERDKDMSSVTVEALVLKSTLMGKIEEFGIVLSKMDQPRVLVAPLNDENEKLSNKFYRSLVSVLSDHGFFLLDRNSLEEFYKEQKAVSYSDLNNRIADFGLKVNADYIIKFDFYKEGKQGVVDCEVVSTSTGKILSSIEMDTGKKSISRRSVSSMGKGCGEKLYKKIRANWELRVKNGKYYTLVIEGYRGYQSILSFIDKLNIKDYVNSVTEIESGSNKSTLLIIYKGKRTGFKSEVFKVFKEMNWSIRLVRSENSRMIVKVLK
ncbi:MAG: hypothetical protein CR982_07430 [Candidatus Cloacimonadota bacterium]|nr:MAG: hypothetical protein CR982_07430 [Candidatus Cloacimonadota bacterium]PIE80164.1 MAG: hypothetical protein CSA15_02075 [Candidatus Delongbacteria bacterium]